MTNYNEGQHGAQAQGTKGHAPDSLWPAITAQQRRNAQKHGGGDEGFRDAPGNARAYAIKYSMKRHTGEKKNDQLARRHSKEESRKC